MNYHINHSAIKEKILSCGTKNSSPHWLWTFIVRLGIRKKKKILKEQNTFWIIEKWEQWVLILAQVLREICPKTFWYSTATLWVINWGLKRARENHIITLSSMTNQKLPDYINSQEATIKINFFTKSSQYRFINRKRWRR